MGNRFKTFIQEPLLQFFVVGLLFFATHSALNDEEVVSSNNKIFISSGDIERLATNWSKRWNRQPTEDELKGLIDSYVKEEVYYREALALGLDRDDTVLRRRLMQKMEFLSNDLADFNSPDDATLKEFLLANSEKYELPARISFTHVYLSADKHGDLFEVSDNLLAVLREATVPIESPLGLGDTFMLPYDFTLETPYEVSRLFGQEFAARLFQTETGSWQGPIASSYGLHLVNISERIEARVPELASVIDRVRTDFIFEQRQKTNKSIYQRLKERYEIVVEDIPTLNSTGMSEEARESSS